MPRARLFLVMAFAAWVGFSCGGCHGGGAGFRQASGPVLEPLSREEAVRLVNNNIAQMNGAIRATGSVDGHFVNPDSGRRVNYNVDGTLFFLSPSYFRFDLKKMGDRQALFGCNDQYYWAYTKEDDAYVCGRMDGSDGRQADVPLHPDQMIEALGLNPIPESGVNIEMHVRHDYQQIRHDGKEYWLDRRSPRLVRKIIFRNVDGTTAMTSDLSDYRPLPGGPMLPFLVNAEWPASNSRLRFEIGRWILASNVVPSGPQFATPVECLNGGNPPGNR